MGSTVLPERGKLFLDTGNRLTEGILDCHQMNREMCSSQLAFDHPELYTGWLKDYDAIDAVLHEYPDLDCIAALYIVDCMLNGKNVSSEILKKHDSSAGDHQ